MKPRYENPSYFFGFTSEISFEENIDEFIGFVDEAMRLMRGVAPAVADDLPRELGGAKSAG